jgi:hypothetical protein
VSKLIDDVAVKIRQRLGYGAIWTDTEDAIRAVLSEMFEERRASWRCDGSEGCFHAPALVPRAKPAPTLAEVLRDLLDTLDIQPYAADVRGAMDRGRAALAREEKRP